MAKVYLMLEDLPDSGPDDPPFSWAVQWGTEGNERPNEPTDAQLVLDRFISVLDGSFRAEMRETVQSPSVSIPDTSRIIVPRWK
jgi:hypothetical protein